MLNNKVDAVNTTKYCLVHSLKNLRKKKKLHGRSWIFTHRSPISQHCWWHSSVWDYWAWCSDCLPTEQAGPPNNKHWRDKLNSRFTSFFSNEYLLIVFFFYCSQHFFIKENRIFQKYRMSYCTVFKTLKQGIEINLYLLWHGLCLRFVELLFCHDILWKSVTRDVPVIDKLHTLRRNVVTHSLRTCLCISRVDELGCRTCKYMRWYDIEHFQPWQFFIIINLLLWFFFSVIYSTTY